MGKNFKKGIKVFLTILQVGVIYVLLSNILLFLPSEKNINTIVKFIFENIFILFIFIYNIRTSVLLKSEKEKEQNTAVMHGSVLTLVYFMDKIVLNDYLEVFGLYAISVIYMLFLLFKFSLIGEKHSMYAFKTKKVSKILLILVIFLVVAGEMYYYFNILQNLNQMIIMPNGTNSQGLAKLLNEEKIKLIVKCVLYLISTILILAGKKNSKFSNKLNCVLAIIILVISVFSIKNTVAYYLNEICFISLFINNFLEIKKKTEIE